MVKKSKVFDSEIYQKVGMADLIIFALSSLSEKKEKCTFEKLAKECFDSFPKSFKLSGYSKWPDSRKVDRPLRTLRSRKLISGDPQTSFSLTKLGRKTAEEIAKRFRQKKLII